MCALTVCERPSVAVFVKKCALMLHDVCGTSSLHRPHLTLTQMPHPMQSSSEMKEMDEDCVTSIQCFPAVEQLSSRHNRQLIRSVAGYVWGTAVGSWWRRGEVFARPNPPKLATHQLSRLGSSSCTPACTSWACTCVIQSPLLLLCSTPVQKAAAKIPGPTSPR
jgi:hypothetical protein